MKKLLCLTGFLLLTFSSLKAQVDSIQSIPLEIKKGSFARIGFFGSTFNCIWMNHMHSFLKKNDFEGLFNNPFTIPFEGGFRLNNWFAGFKIEVPTYDFERLENKLNIRALFVERSVIKTRNYRFNVGLGVSQFDYSIAFTQKEPTRQVDFDDLLYSNFNTSPRLRNTGGAYDFFISYMHREKRKIAIADYVRVGYRKGFKAYSWKTDYFQLLDAPMDQLDMVYFQYMISISRNK
ncbi:hypothetical protein [Haliscomenobacter hydrossis]|uniref:Outer membrane protein beta-barrel domain-containing protein n=1 Tax=Haliscomenobacter hydrossis (strain ATCC 27775 / DSM 1100 / LMG 10767 / O) TaxID=760192 RepID=F4KSS8_HALH1|nr:hypothetical protein [Haliscomenobacter hydrossis]AEE48042.1 hypothetical protein Halhy_0129 [Haliscomenobacter hydrossis DSM 1100]